MPSKPTVLSRTNSLEPDGEKWRKMQKSRLKGVRIYETYTNFCDKREQSQACLNYAEQSKNHD